MDPMGNTSFLKTIRPFSISMMGGIVNDIPGVECGKISCQIIATSHGPGPPFQVAEEGKSRYFKKSRLVKYYDIGQIFDTLRILIPQNDLFFEDPKNPDM